MSIEHGSSQEPILLGEDGRVVVDEWLTGINAVREGTLNAFFILTDEEEGIMVTPENANETEAGIRSDFAPHYPGLLEVTGE